MYLDPKKSQGHEAQKLKLRTVTKAAAKSNGHSLHL